MKKISLIIIIVFIILSCTDQGARKNYDYTITNNSGVTVEIIPYYEQGGIDLSKKIILQNGQSLNANKQVHPLESLPLTMAELISKSENIFLSKVVIVFDNIKKSIYSNDCTYNNGVSLNCDIRNIFLIQYNNEQTEVYTITPEDYQNAVDCGGNCN